MCCKIHKRFFSILIFASLFCCLVTLQNITSAQQTQSATKALNDDLMKFHWLIRLCTDRAVLDRVLKKNDVERNKAINEITDNLSDQEKAKVRSFVNEVKKEKADSDLFAINTYICKQKPCPPIVKPESRFYWLIRSFRSSDYRKRLFNAKTYDAVVSELGSELTENDKVNLKRFVREYPENIEFLEKVGGILCDAWGPCSSK